MLAHLKIIVFAISVSCLKLRLNSDDFWEMKFALWFGVTWSIKIKVNRISKRFSLSYTLHCFYNFVDALGGDKYFINKVFFCGKFLNQRSRWLDVLLVFGKYDTLGFCFFMI